MRPINVILSTLSVAALLAGSPVPAAGDSAKGMKTFKKCKACHNIAKNKHKVGPTLVGVIGRKSGTAKDEKGKLYRYSKAMKAAGDNGIVWNDENLEKFLTKPKKFAENKDDLSGSEKSGGPGQRHRLHEIPELARLSLPPRAA